MELLRAQFRLDWQGIHGVSHWARVRVNGLALAEQTGADTQVVELFAFVHDARRHNDGWDPDHGLRGAELVQELNGEHFELGERQREWIVEACCDHSEGGLDADVTVQTCWDADRLDLGRVGKRPEPRRLCTDAARRPEMIEWALERSLHRRGR